MTDEPSTTQETADSFFDTDLDNIMGEDPGAGNELTDTTNATSGNDATPNQTTTQDGGNSEVQNQGFEKQFINEQGETNLSEAMNFITSNLPQNYDVQDVVTPMRGPAPQQVQVQQPQGTEPQKEPWEIQYEAERLERENHFKPFKTYREYLQKAAEEGFTGSELLRRADQLADEEAERSWSKIRYKKEHESRQAEEKRLSEERTFSELIPKSRTNLGVMYNRFKDGETGFNSLVFGSDIKDDKGNVTGKAKGFGTDFVNYAFQLQNHGKEMPKDPNSPEFKEFADRWWIQFTSNPQNLEHLMDFALSKLHLHLQKYTAAALKKKGAVDAQRLADATTKGKPSQIQRKQPTVDGSDKSKDPFASMLDGKDFVVDSV